MITNGSAYYTLAPGRIVHSLAILWENQLAEKDWNLVGSAALMGQA